jgi:hypothetical protein
MRRHVLGFGSWLGGLRGGPRCGAARSCRLLRHLCRHAATRDCLSETWRKREPVIGHERKHGSHLLLLASDNLLHGRLLVADFEGRRARGEFLFALLAL